MRDAARGMPTIGALPTEAPIINEPGHWDVMISYTQKSSAAQHLAEVIVNELQQRGKTVWRDTKMDVCHLDAMKEAVTNSCGVIAIITGAVEGDDDTAYFRRPYCIQELRWAVEANVPILPVVDATDKDNIGELLRLAPEDFSDLGKTHNIIDFHHSSTELRDASIRTVLKRLPQGSAAGRCRCRCCRLTLTSAVGDDDVEKRPFLRGDLSSDQRERTSTGSRPPTGSCAQMPRGGGRGTSCVLAIAVLSTLALLWALVQISSGDMSPNPACASADGPSLWQHTVFNMSCTSAYMENMCSGAICECTGCHIEDDICGVQIWQPSPPRGLLEQPDSTVSDGAFTASSYFSREYSPNYARMNEVSHWAALSPDVGDDWLRVDLGQPRVLTSIATRGAVCCAEWVTQYRVAYSPSRTMTPGSTWTDYIENGLPKTFDGNFDQNTLVMNQFDEPFSARYVQLTAVAVNAWFSIRIELYTCSGYL
jgi:hypothetical protein